MIRLRIHNHGHLQPLLYSYAITACKNVPYTTSGFHIVNSSLLPISQISTIATLLITSSAATFPSSFLSTYGITGPPTATATTAVTPPPMPPPAGGSGSPPSTPILSTGAIIGIACGGGVTLIVIIVVIVVFTVGKTAPSTVRPEKAP